LPAPERAIDSVPDDVPTTTDADRVPDPVGAKVTLSVQEVPAASAVPALHPRSEKSPGVAPPIARNVIVALALPLFVSVTDFDVDRPTATVPKLIAVALCVIVAVAGGVGDDTDAAAWETRSVRPPIVRFPERAAPVLAATAYPNDALPAPVAAVVTVSHDALLDADHAQPCDVDSVVLPDPPAAGMDADVVPSA
jgi:hypothetical protein